MEWIGCTVVFHGNIIAVFQTKMSQIDTENDKKPKLFQFSKFISFSPTFFTDFVDWKVEKGQQGKMCFPVCLEKR